MSNLNLNNSESNKTNNELLKELSKKTSKKTKEKTQKVLNVPTMFMMFLVFLAFNVLIAVYVIKYLVLTLALSFMFFLFLLRKQFEVSKINSASNSFLRSILEEGSKHENLSLPIPLMIVDEEKKVLWYNDSMRLLLGDEIPREKHLDKIVPGIDFASILNPKETFETDDKQVAKSDDTKKEQYKQKQLVKLNSKFLEITNSKFSLESNPEQNYHILYFYDLSFYKDNSQKYLDERAVIGILEIDNYDEVLSELDENTRPFLQSEIDKRIGLWGTRMNAIIKKYDRGRYFIVVSNKFFTNIEEKRFSILDEIREIELVPNMSPTASIGICADENNFASLESDALSSLEIALGRGGDQAVVKKNNEIQFYGGKAKAVEKRNRVKARIIAHAFRQILDDSNEIYIMGHQYPDMDAFGAAIGIYKAASDRGKKAYIVLEEVNETIKIVYETFEDDGVTNFITRQEAIDNLDENQDLLVVVDTHRPSFTECPELIDIASRKVMFDHHRRGIEFMEDTLLSYLEPYASSTCELVTEVLQYMEKKVVVSKKEAEALLAGIVLDTKNFSIKTGVRTFETAALLKRFGADTTRVKQFMQDDIDSIVDRSNIVSNARMYTDKIAISKSTQSIKNPRLIAAQASDQMLSIRGIDCSFVIVQEGNKVYISGRSLRHTNVQVILEKLGGGGHQTTAGAQFTDISIEEAEQRLIDEIKLYLDEKNNK